MFYPTLIINDNFIPKLVMYSCMEVLCKEVCVSAAVWE